MSASLRAVALLLLAPAVAFATPPLNDDWASRTQIAALPFHVKETQLDSATHDQSDPAPPCGGVGNTLWYGFTTGGSPAYLSLVLSPVADVEGAVLGTIAVYSGTPGAFKLVNGACASDTGNVFKARLFGVRLEPNTAYSIEIGNNMNFGPGQRIDLTVSASPTYTVTKTADTVDGVCDADCSLREAISASNAAPGAVLVPAGTYTLSVAGNNEDANATGDLDVLSGMGIYGAGAGATTIDANHIDRVLDVHGNTTDPRAVMVGDLTLANGTNFVDLFNQQLGGGLRASHPPGQESYFFIGVERVTFIGNTAYYGGGGAVFETRGMLRDCRFTGNSSSVAGGGLVARPTFGQTLDVIGCTFDDNTASSVQEGGFGGGIYASTQGSVRVVNSTISGNHARNGGAGVYAGAYPIVLRSDTIVFNDVTGPGLDAGAGVDLDTFNGANQLANNVIAGNTSVGDDTHADCARHGGATMTTGYNLVQRNGSCTLAGTADIVGTDPLVDPSLANNGGPTPTHALDALSPALDSGDPAGCLDASGLPLPFDQRGEGFPRRSGMRCDIGALERTSNVVFLDGYE